MVEQCRVYDHEAELQSRIWAQEMRDPSAYANRLQGIEQDRLSFQNELQNEDAFWTGTYTLGVDGHGDMALITPEIAIPGRIHRQDSHAMIDSMAGYAVYTLDQITKGVMPHENWEVAREQFHQFRALQREILTLNDGESLLGYTPNGKSTRDGVGLLHITRHDDTFSYETRLVGGLSKNAASDLLAVFVSDNARSVVLEGKTDNPLYMVVRGTIAVDLSKQSEVHQYVRHALDVHGEQLIPVAIVSSCRTTELMPQWSKQKTEQDTISTQYVRRTFEQYPQNRQWQLTHIPFIETQHQIPQQDISHMVHPWGMDTIPVKDSKKVIRTNNTHAAMPVVKKTNTEFQFIRKQQGQWAHRVEHQKQTNIVSMTDEEPVNNGMRKTCISWEQPVTESSHKVILPVGVFVSHVQTDPVYTFQEYAVIVSMHQVYGDLAIQQHVPVYEPAEDEIPKLKSDNEVDPVVPSVEQQDILNSPEQSSKQKEIPDAQTVYMVDAIHTDTPEVVTDTLEKQIRQGRGLGCIKKLVWMEQAMDGTYIPVEQLEIIQDMTVTMQNLLHFLQKIVKKTIGEDKIIYRNISVIAADKKTNESIADDIAYYMTLLSGSNTHTRMFAYVN